MTFFDEVFSVTHRMNIDQIRLYFQAGERPVIGLASVRCRGIGGLSIACLHFVGTLLAFFHSPIALQLHSALHRKRGKMQEEIQDVI